MLKIPDGELLEGDMPKRQMKLIEAWIELHQDELMADWHLASTGQTPFKIDPKDLSSTTANQAGTAKCLSF